MSEGKKLDLSPSASILIAGVIIASAIVFVGKVPSQAQPSPGAVQPEVTATADVPAPNAEDHIIGSLSAPIVLIEYSDFQCPFCQRIHPTLQRIVDESDGQVAWIYRHFPLESIHPEARPSAVASECVAAQLGNDGFWKFAEALFADQGSMGASLYSSIATELGADSAQFASCVANDTYGARVDTEANDAQSSGATGTPYTVVFGNGNQVSLNGALPYAQIQAVIKSVQDRQ